VQSTTRVERSLMIFVKEHMGQHLIVPVFYVVALALSVADAEESK
jgi:hypothetical protein